MVPVSNYFECYPARLKEGISEHSGSMTPPTYSQTHKRLLTAIVVVAPWQELKPQREGGEPLDLFREAHWSERSVRGVTLPPLDGPSGLHAALERGLPHKVQGQGLWQPGPHGLLAWIVWAVNVKVVVQIHLDG